MKENKMNEITAEDEMTLDQTTETIDTVGESGSTPSRKSSKEHITSFTTGSVEALILTAAEPITANRLAQIIPEVSVSGVREIVSRLNARYVETGGSFRIREIAGGYQIAILPDFVGVIDELNARRRKVRLSRAALETLAIVAYKQPVTRTEIETIRGVAADAVVTSLLEKNLVEITGRATTPGKALQYGTGQEFLKFFGLQSLEDLPRMSEIEEMLSAADRSKQTQLQLTDPALEDARMAKLNVADGTYTPPTDEEEMEIIEGEGLRILTINRGAESMAKFSPEDSQESADESLAAESHEESLP